MTLHDLSDENKIWDLIVHIEELDLVFFYHSAIIRSVVINNNVQNDPFPIKA